MPALSILLPTYNGARFLEEQVRSIQQQSFTDWQLLTCDDGSSDDTVALIHRLAAADARIKPLPATGNAGQKQRLKELAEAAQSDLIAVSDQDDVWQPDKLALLIEGLGKADLCFGSSWLIDEHGRELGREVHDKLPPRPSSSDRLTYLFRPAVSAHAMLARRSLFSQGSFARAAPFDWLLSLEAAFGNGLIYVPAARTMHRMHANNQMNGDHAHIKHYPKLISRYEVRNLLRSLGLERLVFLGLLEHLTYAERVGDDVRRRCQSAYRLCIETWHTAPLDARLSGLDLAARLAETLQPLAGSPQDAEFALDRLKHLCRGAFSPERFIAHARRTTSRRAV